MSEDDINWWDPSDLLFAHLPIGPHPAVVIRKTGNKLLVAACTSQDYHDGDDDFVLIPQGEGNIKKSSYVNCLELFEIDLDGNIWYIGTIEDETFQSIVERMQDRGAL